MSEKIKVGDRVTPRPGNEKHFGGKKMGTVTKIYQDKYNRDTYLSLTWDDESLTSGCLIERFELVDQEKEKRFYLVQKNSNGVRTFVGEYSSFKVAESSAEVSSKASPGTKYFVAEDKESFYTPVNRTERKRL